MILRCTRKLLKVIGAPRAELAAGPPDAEDWYANLLWSERRKNLLLTHAGTLFTVFEADVSVAALRDTRQLVATALERELASEGLPADLFGQLRREELRLAPTADRSVLGCMNDMAYVCEQEIAEAGGLRGTDLAALNRVLRQNINSARGYRPPIELAAARRQAQGRL